MSESNTAVEQETPTPAPEAEATPPVEGETPPAKSGESQPKADEGKKPDKGKPDKPKRRARTERYINTLKLEAQQAKEETAYWRGKAEAKKEQAPAEPERPIRADYDDEDEYLEALTDYKVEQKMNGKKADNKPDTVPKPDITPNPAMADFETKGLESYGQDFATAMADQSLPVTQAMGEAVMEAENGPDILMYLSDNPTEARRISKLSIAGQVRELDKLNSKVSDYSSADTDGEPSSPPAKKTSSAPTPPNPEKGSKDAPGGETNLSDIQDINEWMKVRNKTKRTH